MCQLLQDGFYSSLKQYPEKSFQDQTGMRDNTGVTIGGLSYISISSLMWSVHLVQNKSKIHVCSHWIYSVLLEVFQMLSCDSDSYLPPPHFFSAVSTLFLF